MGEVYLSLLGWVLALSLVFHLLERVFAAEKGQPLARWLINLAYAPVGLAFIFAIGWLLGPVFALVAERTGGGLLPIRVGEGSGVAAQILFALAYAFTWDLSQYAMHRLQHAWPVLWETHRFHHDETAVNAATQARIHPAGYGLALLFYLPVIVLFGLQTPHFVATFLLFRLWGFVNHANLRLGFGRFTILLSGPQWHRIHHSVLPEHRDRNFATFFPVIDWLFGTYCRPGRDEYPRTGFDGEPMGTVRAVTIAPFVAWHQMLRSSRRPLS